MRQIPPSQDGHPELYLYESLDELRKELGFVKIHGLYEPQLNRIHATYESLPHELGHFKDHQTGGYRDPAPLEGEQKIEAWIRNEAVAVLYSWIKHASPTDYLGYEKEFLELVYFALESHQKSTELQSLSFSEIQSICDWVCSSDKNWFPRLKALFSHYWKEMECPHPLTQRPSRN